MANFNSRVYSDFDIDFKAHPLTGDLIIKYDDESIKRAVKQLILLNRYDKKYHPEIAGGIRELLFDPMTSGTGTAIEARLEVALKQYEQRIKLHEISAIPDYERNSYEVTLKYEILNTLSPVEQKIFIERVR